VNVIGIGTDLCDCDRIAAMIERHGDTFLQRVFTPAEIEYCSRHRMAAEHFAGRWAVKEAVLKAFGTGWAKGIQWTDLEVRLEEGGRPRLVLHGAAREHADRLGIGEVLISISHTAAMANAFAVAVSPPGSDLGLKKGEPEALAEVAVSANNSHSKESASASGSQEFAAFPVQSDPFSSAEGQPP
jgi:holo-[acyl-carrier protein] synthase